jgi:hypothetical protein
VEDSVIWSNRDAKIRRGNPVKFITCILEIVLALHNAMILKIIGRVKDDQPRLHPDLYRALKF